jgi:hypothetical protein
MYFGEVFGRTPDVSLPWLLDDAEPNADMWARPEETRERIVELYRSTWELADATIDELPLDAVGRVWWWGDSPVTLHRVLVHVTCETQRHAGHADIIRESIDGAAGFLSGHDSLRISEPASWKTFHDRIEEAARLADGD